MARPEELTGAKNMIFNSYFTTDQSVTVFSLVAAEAQVNGGLA
jgi:hypothetical protein